MATLVGTGLLGGAALLVFSFRWGLALILDPEALPQVQSLLTTPLPPPTAPVTTQAALEQSVGDAGQVLGEPIKLSGGQQDADWLIFPVLAADTGNLVKLRLLQQSPTPSRPEGLVDVASVPVAPFAADTILAPFTPQERQAKVAPSEFWPQQLTRLPSPPAPNAYHWLTLKGHWTNQGRNLQYGQIVVLDPERRRLDLLAVWSSPTGQKPQWMDLDGEGIPDLVVDETTSMDPVLLGLQVVDLRGLGPSLQLQAVSWVGVPLDAGPQANRYQKALRLARHGLWRESHQMLKNLKNTLADQWNADAEAQLRLVAHHADRTRQQAEQEWSLPTQKIMALLIDGRWATALETLELTPQGLEPMMRRLASDRGKLWNRISATASLDDPDSAVFVWGGLTLEAKQTRQAAQQWLDRQPVDTATRTRLTGLLASLNAPPQPLAAAAVADTSNPSVNQRPAGEEVAALPYRVQGVIGEVKPLGQLRPEDWYVPTEQPPTLVQGEQWYAVEVPLIRRDREWQPNWSSSAGSIDPQQLWSGLPFTQAPAMTMVRWESSTLGVSHNLYVKGLQTNANTVTLLASGATTPTAQFSPIAFSDGALVWLSATQQGTPSQEVMTPLLDELMGHHGPLPEHVGTYAFGALLQEVKLHTLDLTGDGRPEQVLTFDRAALDQLQGLGIKLDRTAHKTVILTEDGKLLYSNLFQPQTLIALTNPADGLPLSLVIHDGSGYRLLQWSDRAQKFRP